MKRDKLLHIFWGWLFAFVVGAPIYASSHDLFAGLWGCLAGIIAGAVKEWCDNKYNWEWDWKDLLATCIGVAVAMLVVIGLHFGRG